MMNYRKNIEKQRTDRGIMQEKTTDILIGNRHDIENLIYTIRGHRVMLDADLARIYGYETKAFNQQVRRNIERFPIDMMFQLTDEETKDISRSQFVTLNKEIGRGRNIKYNPFVFTEQGVYMLMTVLKGELAVKQSIMLVRVFKGMKDYISDSCLLAPSDEFSRLAAITAQNTFDIARIKETMVEKTDLDKFIKSFNDKRISKNYVILNGQTVEADLAYSDIYAKAKKEIYIVDNYIGLKTLSLLKVAKQGVKIIIFSDNIGNMLRLTDYNDFVTQYKNIKITFQKTMGKFHDRYIILDYKSKSEKIYHCGTSSKDAGKKITSISLIDDNEIYHSMIEELLNGPALVLN